MLFRSEGLETMGDNMFYRCASLREMVIPSTVKSIGVNTFMSCRNIVTLKSLSSVPPKCKVIQNVSPFDDFCLKATLFVPADAIEKYRTVDGWKKFRKIEALEGSGVDNIKSDVNGTAEYYNMNGYKVSPEHLSPGIYI